MVDNRNKTHKYYAENTNTDIRACDAYNNLTPEKSPKDVSCAFDTASIDKTLGGMRVIFPSYICVKKVKIEILEVAVGLPYRDTCISEASLIAPLVENNLPEYIKNYEKLDQACN